MFKVNLGCGPHAIADWFNYDLGDHKGVIQRDLTWPLPHGDDSVNFAFSEHFLEHVTRDQALFLMRECYRVLQKGGALRISTPDLKLLIWNYTKDNTWGIPGVWEPKTPCQMVNEGLHLWGHQFVYDAKELELLLREAGFKTIVAKHWHQSDHEELRGLEVRPFNGELIFEATK